MVDIIDWRSVVGVDTNLQVYSLKEIISWGMIYHIKSSRLRERKSCSGTVYTVGAGESYLIQWKLDSIRNTSHGVRCQGQVFLIN